MRNTSFFALILSVAGCGDPPPCTVESLPTPSVSPLPLGQSADVELNDGSGYAGPLTLTVVDGVLPPGLSIDGTRLVGTPTEVGTTSVTVAVRALDTSVCEAEATFTIDVVEPECSSDQACYAINGGWTDPCGVSSDCAPLGENAGHCVQTVGAEGLCLFENVGCAVGLVARDYVDVEGRSFQSCGSDVAVVCSESGSCDI